MPNSNIPGLDYDISGLLSQIWSGVGGNQFNPPEKDPSLREDGTPKDAGFFGPLETPEGDVATEKSIGVNFDGQETLIPSLTPNLSPEEIQAIVRGEPISPQVAEKAANFARQRLSEGKSPFAGPGEQTPLPSPLAAPAAPAAPAASAAPAPSPPLDDEEADAEAQFNQQMERLFSADSTAPADMTSLLPPGLMERLQEKATHRLGIGEIAGLAALAFNNPELAYRLLESKQQDKEQADQELLTIGRGNLSLENQQARDLSMLKRQFLAEHARQQLQEKQGDIAEHRALTREFADTVSKYLPDLGEKGLEGIPASFPRKPGWRDQYASAMRELQTRATEGRREKAKLAFGKLAKGATPAELDVLARQYGIDPTDDLYVNLRAEADKRERQKAAIADEQLNQARASRRITIARLRKIDQDLNGPLPTTSADAIRLQRQLIATKRTLDADAKVLGQKAESAGARGDVEAAADYQEQANALLQKSREITGRIEALMPAASGETPQPSSTDPVEDAIDKAISSVGKGRANQLIQKYQGIGETSGLNEESAILRGILMYNQSGGKEGLDPNLLAAELSRALATSGLDPAAVAQRWNEIDTAMEAKLAQEAQSAANTGPKKLFDYPRIKPLEEGANIFPDTPPQAR